ncbi:glycolate oxidase subunit GlcE [Comamonas composti]|uniref:glycolate oxidase subunit GlcE n=1 Tax=Comamonas composti TaxID=408558 RepID=UPI0003F6DBB2|nr:glycolate oxidase subunit GlcE [Comamonas composti]
MDITHSALRQTVERVHTAVAERRPLRLRGGGTKDFYRAGPDGELLDTRALAGLISYEPSELVVTARAGMDLAELQVLLAGQRQCLAFEPPHYGPGATVGGMVAAGLSGPARASAGAVRDFVLGLELLNGQGELLRYGGQVMKNVAGYDVSRLMVGAWGTLGLITEVSLKVLPLAPAEATLRFDCDQQQALDWLNAWGGQPLPLNASRWQHEAGRGGHLYLRLRGAQAAVYAACERLGGERLEGVEADWLACRDQLLPWFARRAPGHALWRLSLPQTAPALLLPEGCEGPLIEWHGGLRWVQAPPQLGGQLRQMAQDLGGNAICFRAASEGAASDTGGFDAYSGSALALLHARLKKAFDPHGIFNPGRMSQTW